MIDIKTHWIRCPVCGNKARNRIREDTELRSFPLTAEKGTSQKKIDKPLIEVCRFFWCGWGDLNPQAFADGF